MECPHCKEPLPSKTCPQCREEVPEESRYCLACGAPFDEEDHHQPSADEDTGGLDLENRILCPDGTCTGIIENGRCTECGKPYQGGGKPEAETNDTEEHRA